MRNKFDEQLYQLSQEMIKMGNAIEEAIINTVDALHNRDVELAKSIIQNDSQINHEQKRIEEMCFNLLIQQQPVACDLRTITASLKMVTDMERVGDHAADISEIVTTMKEKHEKLDLNEINAMALETIQMLSWCVDAYIQKDILKAEDVIARDDIVDDIFNNAKKHIGELIHRDKNNIDEAIDLIMIAKYFERIGDHATNIAEWIIYALKSE